MELRAATGDVSLTSILLECPPRLAAAAAEGRTGFRPDALGGGSWRRAARRPRRPGIRRRHRGRRLYLISALVLCVCLARLDCLLRHPPCLTAHGERTWLSWAYRHPEPQDLWRRIARQLRPGEAVVIVARQGRGGDLLVAHHGRLFPARPSDRRDEGRRRAAERAGGRSGGGDRFGGWARGPRAPGGRMMASLVRIALASALAVLAGLPLVAPRRRPRAGDLAAAWIAGARQRHRRRAGGRACRAAPDTCGAGADPGRPRRRGRGARTPAAAACRARRTQRSRPRSRCGSRSRICRRRRRRGRR